MSSSSYADHSDQHESSDEIRNTTIQLQVDAGLDLNETFNLEGDPIYKHIREHIVKFSRTTDPYDCQLTQIDKNGSTTQSMTLSAGSWSDIPIEGSDITLRVKALSCKP
nr:uncharacterized protein CI109_000559 [Kwoniella shandongensis]KAA5530987.1 hypothetical protein CI109_000559 [Kwoniella shandongensis]